MVLYVGWLLMPVVVGADRLPGAISMSIGGTPLEFFADNRDEVARVWVFLGILLLTQWAFLRPLRSGPKGGTGSGRTQWAAIIGVALMTMLLSAGFLATLLELPDWWASKQGKDSPDYAIAILCTMLGMWVGWAAVFYIYWRQGDYLTKAGRVIKWLIRGSCLELLVAIPAHAWAYRRHNDCFCALGTYTGLVFGFGVLCWAFGPGLALLYLREKTRRAEVLERLCPRCGALLAKDGSCPVCGRGL
jgi:hypothetical protein